jgi:sec-independent protein translocase protein TatA
MPQLGVPELLIILVIVVLVFGVGKLPKVGSAIGQSIREFRNATQSSEGKEAGKETTPVSKEVDQTTRS